MSAFLALYELRVTDKIVQYGLSSSHIYLYKKFYQLNSRNSRSQDTIISKESIIVTFSHVKA